MPRKYFKKMRALVMTARIHLSLAWRMMRQTYSICPRDLISNQVITILLALLPFVAAYTNARVIDEIIRAAQNTNSDLSALLPYVVAALGTGYIVDMLWKYSEHTQRKLRFVLIREFGYLIHAKIVSLDLAHFESTAGSALMNRINEQKKWTPANYVNRVNMIGFSLIQTAAAIALILSINPLYILVTTLTLVPNLIASLRASEESWGIWSYKASVRNKYFDTLSYVTEETMIKEIKLFGVATKLMKILKKTYEEFEKFQIRVQSKLTKTKMFAQTIEYLGWSYIYIDVLMRILQKSVSVGNFVLVRSVLTDYSNTTKLLFENTALAFDEGLWVRDMYILLDTPSTLLSPAHPHLLDPGKIPSIEFRRVSFKYPGTKKYIFKNLSFIIQPGEDVALVGENGAGKTTMVKLLCRLYDVTSGQILIEGKNIKTIDLDSWHRQLGTLFQDFNKYAYTVDENLDLGTAVEGSRSKSREPSASMARALTHASAEFVYEYPKGLQTVLSRKHEGGVDPSGGQWQRIALARAFYRDANILILDEPTSAIDAKAEYEIFAKIRLNQHAKTTIIISHRFSTVRSAQRILVLKNGKIIESGSHDQLMQMPEGLYQSLFTKQAEGYQ